MPRIEIRHLEDFAERPIGKVYLGELVRRLVYATTAKRQPNLHFLAGESNGYAGWDGWVEVTYEENGVVRRHRSLWELSADKKFESKFLRDFQSAKTKLLPHGWKKDEVIYVGLTLRSVTPKALDKIKAKFSSTERRKWAGVVLLAADDLVQWIEKNPTVEDWATDELQIGVGRFGRSLNYWYSSWTKQTTPPVTEQLLTAGRDISKLSSIFRVDAESVSTIQCDSTEEAIALIYCAVQTLPESDAQIVLASSLVVIDQGNAEKLADVTCSPLGMPTVVLAPPATVHRNRLIRAGYRVIQVLGRADDSSDVIRFERSNVQDFAAALAQSMELNELDAEVCARSVGCSVSIWHIQNLFKQAQQPDLPDWATTQDMAAVVAAIFAGAWREDSVPDMAVLGTLSGMREEQFIDALSPFASCVAPLLELVGSSRFVVAPTAAFEFIQRVITKHHIARLSEAVASVFSGVSPDVKDRWLGLTQTPRVRDSHQELSRGLRDGLAETLLRIAVLGDPLAKSGALQGHASAQGYVDHLMRKLDGLSSDPRILASLDQQLPVLIEAAPSPFLDALDALIQGAPDQLSLMLADESGIFGRSFQTGLLWGLEALAWSRDLLPRAASILASLARLDPGGQLSNRPSKSLWEIFLPWHPGTSCTPATRAEILRSVVEHEPEVGWRLLVDLLPGNRSISTRTHRPSWRSLGQLDRSSVKRSEVVEAYELTVMLALEFAGTDPAKLLDLVGFYPNLSPHHKSSLEAALREVSRSSAAPDALQRLWWRLDKLCRKHSSFADADWAMPSAELVRLQDIAGGFSLKDPVLKHRWLFDEQFPDLGGQRDDYGKRSKELQVRRQKALNEVLSAKGWEGIHQLISVVSYGYIVGTEVGRLECEDIEVLQAMNSWQALHAPDWMVFRSASTSRASIKGSAWTSCLLDFARSHGWPPLSVAMALVDYPDERETYDTVRALGEEVGKEYWTRRFGFVRGADDDIDAFRTAVEQLVHYGRAVDLIDQNWSDLPKLGYELVLRVIDSFIEQLPKAERLRSSGTIQHDLQSLFNWLLKEPGIELDTLARREYALLPLLTDHGISRSDLALHELLKQQPQFFVDVVCDLYKPASSERELAPGDVEQAKLRAHVAYELLGSWKTPPGLSEGIVDAKALGAWVDAAREMLRARDRAEVGDQTIGKLLFYLPVESSDGAFPPIALRILLERWRSSQLERGIELEAFNSRGVYSKNFLEGGSQERGLASQWFGHAAAMGAKWTRAKRLCTRIGEMWMRQAEAEDLDAKRDRVRQSR